MSSRPLVDQVLNDSKRWRELATVLVLPVAKFEELQPGFAKC